MRVKEEKREAERGEREFKRGEFQGRKGDKKNGETRGKRR